jgi:thymidylate synthase
MQIYKDYSKRTPDSQYSDVLRSIIDKGVWSETRQGPRALTLIGAQMHFNFSNGFPLITDRSIENFWKKPIGELCAFINGARTREQLAEFGCTWWDAWTTPEKTLKRGLEPGDIGPGSYGAAFHDFPTKEGPGFDQFKHLVEQIKELPELRTHFVTPWIPQYIVRGKGKHQKVTIAPCHGWVHVRILNDELYLHMYQRSGDVPIGVPSNMVQYAALALMLGQLTGYKPVQYVHTISDAHIYEDQLDKIKEMLKREPLRFPTVKLTEEGKKIKDIHDFRGEHFELSDYHPHPSIPKIPVAT